MRLSQAEFAKRWPLAMGCASLLKQDRIMAGKATVNDDARNIHGGNQIYQFLRRQCRDHIGAQHAHEALVKANCIDMMH